GTGLGLAVVYGIVTNHEGFIDVRSAPGAGAEFELLLPRTSRTRETTAPSARVTDLARGRGTVLVVDDEQQILEIMSRVLVDCGYTVITAGDGAEALDRFGTGAGIDLVVLDIVMPNLGGKECLTRLRERRGDVRVLVTTGHTSEGAAREMVQRGALDIIEKPLDLKAFARAVARHVSAA
ncbi:MAG TPA: response regulator, partial [Spirochaetia bacterium]|nr:response regulator [Spirochaetia bacterium]